MSNITAVVWVFAAILTLVALKEILDTSDVIDEIDLFDKDIDTAREELEALYRGSKDT